MSNATERMAGGHQLLLLRESQAHMQNTAKQEHLELGCELLGGGYRPSSWEPSPPVRASIGKQTNTPIWFCFLKIEAGVSSEIINHLSYMHLCSILLKKKTGLSKDRLVG